MYRGKKNPALSSNPKIELNQSRIDPRPEKNKFDLTNWAIIFVIHVTRLAFKAHN